VIGSNWLPKQAGPPPTRIDGGRPVVRHPANRSVSPLLAHLALLSLPGCTALSERFFECSFPSQALGREESYAVYLPAARPERAILFLHGAGRDHLTLFRSEAARRALEASRAAIVFPRGRGGWWIDAPALAGSRYESFALETMDRAAAALGVPAEASRWAAAGWSMGGFGSLRLVERHPKRFGAWAGLIALADFPNPAYPKEQNHSVPAVFGAAEGWRALNPIDGVEALRGKGVWFLTGDRAFDRSMNETLARRLTELRIEHEFAVVPGGHEFRVIEEQLPALLRYLESRW
jgi:S-formylglutathione hydrolase FrmB